MKVDSKVLNRFLDKVTIGGDGIRDGIVDFSEEGLKVNLLDETNTLFIVGNLKKNMFKDYKVLGKVAVANFTMLKNVTNGDGRDERIQHAINLSAY